MKFNYGKKFEDEFKKNWKISFPDTLVLRLHDDVGGYYGVDTPCDFICFPDSSSLFMIECKTHKGASIPFSDIPQYERQLKYMGLKNVYPGVILWLYEKDKILWISIEEMKKMRTDGEKSIGLRMLKNKQYDIYEIPSTKKRVFMNTDYTKLLEYNIKVRGLSDEDKD